jgi:hypothetical protein
MNDKDVQVMADAMNIGEVKEILKQKAKKTKKEA